MEHDAKALLEKYRLGTCTPEEQALVERYLNKQVAGSELMPSAEGIADSFSRLDAAFARKQKASRRMRTLRWFPYAAAAILIAATAVWLVMGEGWQKFGERRLAAADILPGGNKATLTLADGRTIDLDEAQTGIIVGAEDITYQDGSAVGPANSPHAGLTTYDLQLTTPKGGQYQITLPDGSKVWLNSASTLKYPSRFSDASREVILEGEAYFDISSAPMSPAGGGRDGQRGGRGRLPFLVKTNNQTVEVLGTQFNLSAYPDDPETKTTLVEGKVRVDGVVDVEPVPTRREAHNHAPNKSSVILSPGQQATIRGSDIQINEVNTDQYTAWKSGLFTFHNTDLQSLMRQLARWYDVEVAYEGELNYRPFHGSIERSYNLGEVLEVLKLGNVNFRLERPERDGGRPRLVVLPHTE